MKNMTRLAHARSLARSGQGRRLREAAELSLREVAEEIGVTPTTLARWERGLNRPRESAALRWADALDSLSTLPPAGHPTDQLQRKD